MGRLTHDLERSYHNRAVVPVIVEASTGRFDAVRATLKQLTPTLKLQPQYHTFLPRISPMIEFSMAGFKEIPLFNMVSTALTPDLVDEVAQMSDVKMVYPDSLHYALQVVPPEGRYKDTRGNLFTSTYWTKRMLGVDKANDKGFTGRGITAAVIDTGARNSHPQLHRVRIQTAMPEKGGSGEDCVSPDTLVFSGGVKEIKDVKVGDPVVTSDGEGVISRKGRKDKPLLEMETRVGSIKASPDHYFYVDRVGWKKLSEIRPGDYVLAPSNVEVEVKDVDLTRVQCQCLGYYLGDGTLYVEREHGSYQVGLREGEEDCKRVYMALFKRAFTVKPVDKGPRGFLICSKRLAELIERLGLGRKSVDRTIPGWVFSLPSSKVKAFIKGYFDADGSLVNTTTKRISFSSSSRKLLEQLKWLLLRIGIVTNRVKVGTRAGTVVRFPERFGKASADAGQLPIAHNFHVRFAREVGSDHPSKRERLKKLWQVSRTKRGVGRIGRGLYRLPGDFIAARVISITPLHNSETWDIEVLPQHNYLANTLLTHNSNGHGSWCTATVGGVAARDPRFRVPVEGMAPECNLLSIQALGFIIGMGTTSDILQAMDMAGRAGAKVLSLSLGSNDAPPDSENPEAQAINKLVETGIIPCIAAGNSGPDPKTVGSPGCAFNSLTVGSISPLDASLSKFSSRGPTAGDGFIKPDVTCPGEMIDSALEGLLDAMVDPQQVKYGPISGTSMATPHCAGLVTCMAQLYKERLGKELTVAEVKRMMEELGTKKSNDDGWGLITWPLVEEWVESEHRVSL